MPRILRGLKSVFVKEQPIATQESSLQQMVKRFMSLTEHHLPSNMIDRVSELYAEAHTQVTNFTQHKSHGELIFMGSILLAVALFVVVLPLFEAFSREQTITTKRSAPSSNSSATESLETIEESEEEDIPDPIEFHASLKFVDQDDEVIQVYDDQPFTSLEKFDDDDKASDATPVTVDETPTTSPCVTPLREKPTLNNNYESVPIVSTGVKRSSFAKMKGKMSSSLSFRRKESSDVSVTSTSSNRSFRMFTIKSKKD